MVLPLVTPLPRFEEQVGALQSHLIDPDREDVYLASVHDQEMVLREDPDFRWRLLLGSHIEPGRHLLIDCWRDEQAMQLALAASRTLASAAALLEPQAVTVGTVLQIAGFPLEEDGASDIEFALTVENWVKEPCLAEYLESLRAQGQRQEQEQGFRHRLMLREVGEELHFHVVDLWSTEAAAFDSVSRRQSSPLEAVRFLGLLAERGRTVPAWATLRTASRHSG